MSIEASAPDARWRSARHGKRKNPSDVLQPARLLAFTVAIFFVTLLVAPVEPTVALDPTALFYWVLTTGMFWLGMRCNSGRHPVIDAAPARGISYTLAARRTIVMGAIGILLLAIDRYVVRGAPLEWDILGTRDAISDTSTGLVGTLAAFFGAFAPFGFVLTALAKTSAEAPSRKLQAAGGIVALLYVLLSVTVGSRSLLVVTVVVHVVSFLYFNRITNRRLPLYRILLGSTLLVATVLASAVLMLERLEQMGLDPLLSLQVSGYAESLQPSSAALAWIDSHPESSSLLAALFSLCLYVYHGLFEFSLLFNHFRDAHTLGAWEFWLPIKLVSVGSGIDMTINPADLAGVREGLFTTFVGPVYVDFGWFGPVFTFLLGWTLALPTLRMRQGYRLWLPAACTISALVIMYPVINLIDSASGAYPLVAAVLLTRFGHPSSHRHKRHHKSSPPALNEIETAAP